MTSLGRETHNTLAFIYWGVILNNITENRSVGNSPVRKTRHGRGYRRR